MGQLETTVQDVSARLEELTRSTRESMNQLRHDLGLLKVKTRFSRTLQPGSSASTSNGAGPSSTSLDSSRSTAGASSELVEPARLAGLEAAGSDLRQNIQDLASVVGATERLLRAELAKQIEQLRSEMESDRSKVSHTTAELVRVTCTIAEVRERMQDAEGKMQDGALELSTVKLSVAAFVKDMQISIRDSEQRQRDGVSEEVARSLEGFERSWSQHLRQQLERHRDEQVSRMSFLQQLQEESAGCGRTDTAASQLQLDRIDAALQDLATERAAQHEALAVQVQQLEGSCLASRKDLASMRSDYDGSLAKLGSITEVVAQAAAASIQRTEARLATELDSKREELAKFVGAQQEELRLKASSLMGSVLAEKASQDKEGPEPSRVSVGGNAAVSDTQARSEGLTARSIFGSDAKSVISMLRQCLGQVDELRTQVRDLQPRVSLLERDGITDNMKPAQVAPSKAASNLSSAQFWSSPAPQQRQLGSLDSPKMSARRIYLTKAGTLARAVSSEAIGLSVASGAVGELRTSLLASETQVQQPVPSDPGAEQRSKAVDDRASSVPGLVASAASISQLQQRSRESPLARSFALPAPSRRHSFARTSPCGVRRAGVSPTPSATSASSARPTVSSRASATSPPSGLKVTYPPSGGANVFMRSVATGFVERQPIRVVGVD